MPNNPLQKPVLVLNANFEPLNVCSTRRALGLVISEKAALIKNGRGNIKTISISIPVPSIIKLQYMIKRPRPQVKLNKTEIYRRDNHTCQYCGKQTKKLTLDHIIPKRLGGVHTWENLVAACPSCNHRKGGRTPEQANMRLLTVPKAPSASASYLFSQYLKSDNEWFEFIKGW